MQNNNKDTTKKNGLLTAQDVADMVSVKRKTVYDWVYKERIDCIHLTNGTLRFDSNDIQAWINKKKKKARNS